MSSPLPLYWSEAFITNEYHAALNQDAAFRKAAAKFSDTIVLRCLDTPEGFDIEARYRIHHGVAEVELEVVDAPSHSLRSRPFDSRRAFARTTAPFRLWAQLDRGEINVLQAITKPDYQLDGNKFKVVAKIQLFNAMNAACARLAKRYSL